MHIEINYRDGHSSQSLDAKITATLESVLEHMADKITRIEVHLGDENSHKSGPADKRCLIEARPAGLDPIAVETHGEDLYDTFEEGARKLKRALTTRFEKHGS